MCSLRHSYKTHMRMVAHLLVLLVWLQTVKLCVSDQVTERRAVCLVGLINVSQQCVDHYRQTAPLSLLC